MANIQVKDGNGVLQTLVCTTNGDGSLTPHHTVDGTVTVSDTHITATLNQDANGNIGVNVENFPTSQAVSSTQLPSALDGSGNLKVAVENSPSVIISGTPSVTVSGTASVNDTTGNGYLQTISGTVSSGKVAVTDAAAETSLSTIAGAVSSSKMAVSGTVNAVPVPVTSGGVTPAYAHISSNAVQAVKATAGQIYGYFLDNQANSVTTFFQFFNVAAGSVNLGTTAPFFVIPMPAGQAANLPMPQGIAFGTAISYAATTTYNGSTAPASAVDCTIFYN